jgi:hypothetical protein
MKMVAASASIGAFLTAAKAHGRQIRLERELAGYSSVTFGAPNAPFVEALWRRDRIVYWSVAATVCVVALAYGLVGARKGWPQPMAGADRRSWLGFGMMVTLWPLIAAFLTAGTVSQIRFLSASHASDVVAPALWGGAAWWGATLSLLAVALFTAFRRAT